MSDPTTQREKPGGLVERAISVLMAVMLLVVFLAVMVQVVYRYVLVHPLAWTQELAQYAFIWMVYLGAGVGVQRGIHLRINVLAGRLSPRWRRAAEVFSSLVSMILAIVFVGAGGVVSYRTWTHTSPALGLPMGVIYLVFPISGLFLWATLLAELRRAARGAPPQSLAPEKDR